mmetsp:Transcript_5848/g.14978  ORF Transcript_5848/g.14978 Transcript_5848/m.14978 type:complete len:248 (-) Transcript_5848:20-763(-)
MPTACNAGRLPPAVHAAKRQRGRKEEPSDESGVDVARHAEDGKESTPTANYVRHHVCHNGRTKGEQRTPERREPSSNEEGRAYGYDVPSAVDSLFVACTIHFVKEVCQQAVAVPCHKRVAWGCHVVERGYRLPEFFVPLVWTHRSMVYVELQVAHRPAEGHIVAINHANPVKDNALIRANADVPDVRADGRDGCNGSPHDAGRVAAAHVRDLRHRSHVGLATFQSYRRRVVLGFHRGARRGSLLRRE